LTRRQRKRLGKKADQYLLTHLSTLTSGTSDKITRSLHFN